MRCHPERARRASRRILPRSGGCTFLLLVQKKGTKENDTREGKISGFSPSLDPPSFKRPKGACEPLLDFPGILRGAIAASSETTAVLASSAAALKRKRPRADGDAQKTIDYERPFLSSTGRGAFFLFGKTKRKNGGRIDQPKPCAGGGIL